MNTIADFHELLLEQEKEVGIGVKSLPSAASVCFTSDEEEPSLALSDSSCSFDDSYSNDQVDRLPSDGRRKRAVVFNEYVEIREYATTLGDHPMCSDGLPLSLDWSYAEPISRHIDRSKSRGYVYTAAPRLSLSERRRRLSMEWECDIEAGTEKLGARLGFLGGFSTKPLFSLLGNLHQSWISTVPPYSIGEIDDRDDNLLFIPSPPSEVLVDYGKDQDYFEADSSFY